jgi:1-aminocyclopropane-1-carboxylate deaminase
MINAFAGRKEILGFSVLKGGGFLKEEVNKWRNDLFDNWRIEEDYHFGGYAKTTNELMKFIDEFEDRHQLLLDQVYTAKMMFGIINLIKKGFFKSGSTVLALHTGGLQGKTIS